MVVVRHLGLGREARRVGAGRVALQCRPWPVPVAPSRVNAYILISARGSEAGRPNLVRALGWRPSFAATLRFFFSFLFDKAMDFLLACHPCWPRIRTEDDAAFATAAACSAGTSNSRAARAAHWPRISSPPSS